MLNYAICEISGKQYKVVPGKPFEVCLPDNGNKDEVEANVLLLSEDGKLQVGNPFLKDKLTLKKVEDLKGPKIRVAKYHAKANCRSAIGFRSKLTKIVLDVKKS